MAKRKSFLARFGAALDAVEFRIAPKRYAQRKVVENLLRMQERMVARDAADHGRLKGSKWLASRLSVNSELEIEQEDTRNRSRDLYLNDPIAAGYVKGRVTNVVGTGLTPQAQIQAGDAIDQERAEKLNRQIEEVARRQMKRADLSGLRSLWMIQRLVQRCVDRDGEAFVVFSDRLNDRRPVPLSVEVVSVHRVVTPPGKEGEPDVRLGRRVDRDGVVVSYFVRRAEPNDTKEWDETYDEVPASRVCHIYEEEEANQARGWPAATPNMKTLKNAADYEEAVIIARQVKACFTAFIPKSNPMGAAIGAATGTTSSGQRLQSLEPGLVHYYDPAAEGKIEFADPGGGGEGDHSQYMESLYRKTAAGYNYPSEALTKNYGAMNFSSSRASLIEGRIEFDAGQMFQVDLFLGRWWELLVQEAVIAGLVDISPQEFLAAPHVFTRHFWIPARRDWVDPLKDVTANNKAVEGGITSKTMVAAASGSDFDTVLAQRTRERIREVEADMEVALRQLDAEKAVADYRSSLGLPDPAAPDEEDGQGEDA